MDELFHAGERILDIGCGTGEDAAHFAARGVQVHATDASPAMVQVARDAGNYGHGLRRRRARANRQIVRRRHLEFRRAELRGESARRRRFAGRDWCARAAAWPSACWGAFARGRPCTMRCAAVEQGLPALAPQRALPRR